MIEAAHAASQRPGAIKAAAQVHVQGDEQAPQPEAFARIIVHPACPHLKSHFPHQLWSQQRPTEMHTVAGHCPPESSALCKGVP